MISLLVEFDGIGPTDPTAASQFCSSVEAWLESDEAAEQPADYRNHVLADVWFMQGMLHHAAGDLDGAISHLQRSIDQSKKIGHVRRHILGLRSIAVCFEDAGLQADSTRSIFEALDLAEDLGDAMVLALVSHALTALYQAQAAYTQMLESAMRTAEFADRSGDDVMRLRAYSGVGIAFAFDGRPNEGFMWNDRAAAIAIAGGLTRIASFIDFNHMFLLQRAGRIDEAVRYADMRSEATSLLPTALAAAISVIMAEVYLEAGMFDRAEHMLERAAAANERGQLTAHLIAYYTAAARLHEAKGNASQALEMMKMRVKVDGEIRGREAQARLVALERYFARELAAKTEEIHHLRTVELVDKNNQLADLLHQKDEILHVVAHDLRNPLAAAHILGESLMIDLQDKLEPDAFERLESIRDAATEMRTTIDTLLQSESVEDVRNPSSVSAAVEASVRVAHHRAVSQRVTLETSIDDVALTVDSALLRRSVDDLLWNAVDSATEDAAIRVRLVASDRGARVTMIGDGVRFDEPTRGRSLYIARRLIERMNGSLNVSAPTVDGGQTVTIDLRG